VEDVDSKIITRLKETQTINGKEFYVYPLKESVWRPLKQGTLKVEPFSVVALLRVKVNSSKSKGIFDDFFGKFENVTQEYTSNTAFLKVTDLTDPVTKEELSLSREEVLSLMNEEVKDQNSTTDNAFVIATDVSLSMWCNDFKPDRLTAIKSFLQDLIRQSPKCQIGVIPFSEHCHSSGKLKSDILELKNQIEDMEYDSISPGTALGHPVFQGIKILRQNGGNRSIVLISDGSNSYGNISLGTAGQIAKRHGIIVHTVCIASDKEAKCLTDSGSDELKFSEYLPKVKEQELKQIAETTGGKFYRVKTQEEFNPVLDNLVQLLN
jgi:hypothetical protein